MADISDVLQECIDKFWNDNPELKREILRDLYATGRVCIETTEHGIKAVYVWLKNAKDGADQQQRKDT